MEELRIKCPSCGIVLDVRNSKNEAVKQIVCPNCKKHLAVTFRDETPKAAQFVEIKMVQLADGSTKTVIRVLTDNHTIKLNGEQLQKDDEVVLTAGDQLQIDDRVGTFGSDGFLTYQKAEQPPVAQTPPTSTLQHASIPEEPVLKTAQPTATSSSNTIVLLVLAIAIVVGGIVWKFWPTTSDTSTEAVPVLKVDSIQPQDTPTQLSAPSKQSAKVKQELRVEEKKPSQRNISSLNNYELERLAMSGDVDAQCMLGKRWVNMKDSVSVVKGIKYLNLAARNGSSEARNSLRTVFSALQQSAANGNSMAANILREQR